MSLAASEKPERKSGVEMLKIIAIILIITSHITQTLQQKNNCVDISDYILDYSRASLDVQSILLQFMRSFGAFGNLLFFVCSAWFLLDSKKVSAKKWLQILLQVWSVSIIITALVLISKTRAISLEHLIKSLIPNICANNWYITCYLLFYPIHVFLNNMIYSMEKKSHLKFVLGAFLLYFITDFLLGSFFFYSYLLLWMVIYVFMGYIRKYMPDFVANKRLNIKISAGCIALYLLWLVLSNAIGMKVGWLSHGMLRWCVNYNPFLLIASISLFNISNRCSFKSGFVNYISRLSLLIYIIHENILIRTYYRPFMWEYVHSNYGYSHIILWILFLALLIFAASVALSILYKYTVGRIVMKAADFIYEKIKTAYARIEEKLIRIS